MNLNDYCGQWLRHKGDLYMFYNMSNNGIKWAMRAGRMNLRRIVVVFYNNEED